MMIVRLVLIDDHEIIRAGLITMLSREPDLLVVGDAANGADGLALVAAYKPEVAVVDYRMPGMSGVEVCQEITAKHPATKVVMLTTMLTDEVVRQSLDAGARAYVYKDVQAAELKRAVRAVAAGHMVIDPHAASRVVRWANQGLTWLDKPLSTRELDVLRLVADGATNQGIAEALGLSENTVRTYLRRANLKLGSHKRGEAALAAGRRGDL